MRIFMTGDTHGDFRRVKNFCEIAETTKDDVLIILGDAGINYYLNRNDELKKCEIDRLPITLFCIHGNHEERPYMIDSYHESTFLGGTVYIEDEHPNIIFAKDGEIYDINNHKTIVIGGAYSVDKSYRLAMGYRWFETEQPNDEIKAYVESQLDTVDWNIDFVLTHTTPFKYEPTEWFLECIDQSTVDDSTEKWLDTIEERLTYNKWFAGHFHGEKNIDKLQLMFTDYVEIL